ncbi:MAG: DNA gyrase subunit A [Rhodospirillales bacterium]|nr:DNA gyrase subunit A [Rhodospirillales bacterium]MBT5351357.1 DNA gyrase subunit A [Rhodospirillales bacterium]MBT5519300.1 DNA gyrase subunit A [Rhodospirillales bacterium]MBT6826210.1 DNA gyrase subunit A [Rhodospirillales bacterium]MBT7146058.1 DNA gyrase subunit A [Rhodospirillales bacterium]
MSTPPDSPENATPTPPSGFDVSPITIEEEMRSSYLDYAMSVIVSRALPDVRDGLKPVHRRILYAMKESGYEAGKPYRKSARIVGDVMGKYHPHGDQAIYDSMVRMAQTFSLRLPLIDGQGNFGSMDGDRAAAMRYTEARLDRAAHTLLEDIDRDTVDFQANYDESTKEPSVLPAGYPNLLVNGAGGIAVGMATNIPPHNLGEVVAACCAYIENPDITIDEIIDQYVSGPDFPTGGLILGQSGIRSAFHTGRGSVVMRGRTSFEEIRKDRIAIIVHEIPYQVNKSRMIEIMAEAVRDKKIEGISDLRDESDRDGVRVVIELKRDAEQEVVLAQLFRFTPLQTSFGVNMLALHNGQPQQMNIKQIIVAFVAFREEVIRRRTIFELGKARDKAHVLAGLAVAVANIDAIIKLIRAAKDPQTAREQLQATAWPAQDVEPMIALLDEPGQQVVDGKYHLSETQAKAILELRLHRLTGLERDKIGGDLRELSEQILEYLEILRSREKLYGILREELVQISTDFANERRTTIIEQEFESDIEDLIQREDMVVTVTDAGYVKRVPLSTYRAQRRGGKGRSGMSTRDEDFVTQVFVVNTHTPVLFFSSTGMVYKTKVYKLPLGTPTARGKALINLLPLDENETISTLMPLPEDEATWSDLFVMFATSAGNVRRNRLSDFTNVMANGKIAMKLNEGDQLVRVRTCTEDEDVLLNTYSGKCIRFPVEGVRVFSGRTSVGVRGMRLAKDDEVMSMSVLHHVKAEVADRDTYLQSVGANRRLQSSEYTDRADDKARDEELASRLAEPMFQDMAGNEEFVLTITKDGFGKRTSAYEYRIAGRGGKGITAIDTARGKKQTSVVASFAVIEGDQLVMVSDGGQLIRCGIDSISIVGRSTRGVTIFKTAEDESVVSVSRLREDVDGDEGDEEDGEIEAVINEGEAAPEGPTDVNEDAADDDDTPAESE